MSLEKSSFLRNNLSNEICNYIGTIFPFKMEPLDFGFKYSGFKFKPLGYYVKDWRQILKTVENKLSHWTQILIYWWKVDFDQISLISDPYLLALPRQDPYIDIEQAQEMFIYIPLGW